MCVCVCVTNRSILNIKVMTWAGTLREGVTDVGYIFARESRDDL